jgi:hypothetical protein
MDFHAKAGGTLSLAVKNVYFSDFIVTPRYRVQLEKLEIVDAQTLWIALS